MKEDVQVGLSNWIVNNNKLSQLLKKTSTGEAGGLRDGGDHVREMMV